MSYKRSQRNVERMKIIQEQLKTWWKTNSRLNKLRLILLDLLGRPITWDPAEDWLGPEREQRMETRRQ